MKKIVVIGGGTGSFTVLTGIKMLKDVDITAIVPSTDAGGSTGRLRDEFGFLPVGDMRQCLVALADEAEDQRFLRDLFTYRFNKGGNGLEGHTFGNLFMTAVRDTIGDELRAIKTVQKLLKIKGNVFPVTLEKCELVAEYENGTVLKGEHLIDEPPYPHDGTLHITKLYTEPQVSSHENIKKVIKEADMIIFGPGDIYTSILANIVIDGVAEMIEKAKAKKVYFSNLVTRFGQTHKFKLSDFVNEMEKYTKVKMDYIFVNSKSYPKELLIKYAAENASPVEDDMVEDTRVIRTDLLAKGEIIKAKGDTLKRSLMRHDPVKIAKVIKKIL